MADTTTAKVTTAGTKATKRSKIVSEVSDDLEESLMQEFNMRLKTCMEPTAANPEEEQSNSTPIAPAAETNASTDGGSTTEQYLYENVEIIKSNGKTEFNLTDSTNENSTQPSTETNSQSSVVDFIQIERENIILENGGGGKMKKTDVENNENLGSEHNIVIYENLDPIKPKLDLPIIPMTSFTEPTDDFISSPDADNQDGRSSVKDRMLLSTDEASCLLFTQTVTSPMLTPSEENIDFLKGFQRESSQNTLSDTSPRSEQNDELLTEEIIYENVGNDDDKDDDLFLQDIVKDIQECEELKTHQRAFDDDENGGFVDEGIDIDSTIPSNDEEQIIKVQRNCGLFVDHITDTSIFEFEQNEALFENEQTATNMADDNQDITSTTSAERKPLSADDYPMIPSVKSLKSQYIKSATTENLKMSGKEKTDIAKLKSLDIMKQINKFEQNAITTTSVGGLGTVDAAPVYISSTEVVTESSYHVETVETKSTSGTNQEKSIKKKKSKKSRHEKENISVQKELNYNCYNEDHFYNVNVKSLCRSFGDLTRIEDEQISPTKLNNNYTKSSFSKFDALQKKNVLHVRSTDSSKATEKFNGNGNPTDVSSCKSCGKVVFQMEQIKAEKCIWHKNCFRCTECNKQLTVDTYQSHEATLYCKPHFKALFTPKAVEDNTPQKPRKHELIIRENQPLELPPDVARASDKPDLGLDELQSLNVKERFHVFEHHIEEENQLDRNHSAGALNVKRSASILSKLARFQAKGMDVGVTDDVLNGIPIEESSSDADEDDEQAGENGEDVELVRAKRAQKEKPFHFIGMSDVKSKWESPNTDVSRDERREERKQEIQSIRSRLFMGKQGKMKEAYQQAVMESESGANVKRSASTTMAAEVADANSKSIKERFEKGGMQGEGEGGAGKAGQELEEDMQVFESGISKKSRSIFLELDANASKAAPLSPISPQRSATNSNITKARDETAQSEVYRDPNIIRAEEAIIEDSVVAKQTHTATKMLNKFRQMEENGTKEQVPLGPKPLKRFTPPPESVRRDSASSDYSSSVGSDEEDNEDDGSGDDHLDNGRSTSSAALPDADLIEAQKAARAKQLRAKFERWEAQEIRKETVDGGVNVVEADEEAGQVESTKSLRARFESLRETTCETKAPRIKVNRFVEMTNSLEICQGCQKRVYPLEKISVHGYIYHKKCFKCMECNTILRMDSYSYNQGLLYCTPHFKRLFISKGNYDTAFGLEQHKEKWNTTVA